MTCEIPRSKHELYNTWRSMIRRCHNPNADNYPRYGGRGIHVCPEWRESFDKFLADVPPRPARGYTLERIDNDGPYAPGNVRWATPAEQARNTRANHYLTARGQTRLLEDWVEITGIPKSTLFNRIKAGWTDEQVVNTPVRPKAPDNSILPADTRRLALEHGLAPETVASRIRRGWDLNRALTQPAARRHP
ncbi:hypothetical protein [Streptomyces spiralis]|uniref:hypothetical protein n=1 Tax=Streptomyces spiralis TaxID=66376 RepID=UPI003684155B